MTLCSTASRTKCTADGGGPSAGHFQGYREVAAKFTTAGVSLSDGREGDASMCVTPSTHRGGGGTTPNKSQNILDSQRRLCFGQDEQKLYYFKGLTAKRDHANGKQGCRGGRQMARMRKQVSATKEGAIKHEAQNDPTSPSETPKY